MTEIPVRPTKEHIETEQTYLTQGDLKKLVIEDNIDETEVL